MARGEVTHRRSGPSGEARNLLSLAGCAAWNLKRDRNMLNIGALSYEDISISQLINVVSLVSHILSEHIRKTNRSHQHTYQRRIAPQSPRLWRQRQFCNLFRVRVQLKCDGTRLCTGGEVKGKLANGVGSQYPSLPRNLVHPALLPLMRTPRLPVVD